MKIYHHDENYHQAHQIEDMRSAHEPNQHCLTQFSSIYHFLTFPGGWVVGWVGEIKINDHLSPAEAEIRAELGNKSWSTN